jgi:hypothetical protein
MKGGRVHGRNSDRLWREREVMTLHNAAALALVGWYLIVPPIRADQVLTNISFRWWTVSESFDSAAACEKKRLALLTDPIGKVVWLDLPKNFDVKSKNNEALLTTAI